MMSFLSHALARVLLFLSLTPGLCAQDSVPTMRQADSLLRRQRWSKAAEAFEKITAAEPQNGRAWFKLGSARHALKDWVGAAEANARAATFPGQRPSALYNLCCAQSLGGKLEDARTSLGQAIEAGFLDFDLIASDADLVALRAREELELSPQRTYLEQKARNGILMRYSVIEPAGFDKEKSYPVLAAFAPGSGVRSADWMMEELWGDARDQKDWLVVCLVAPEGKGWFTHPSHHALEDVLRALQKEYKVAGGRFHLFGFASGCRPALTYSMMSKKYFQTLTLVSSSAWDAYDDGDMRGWRKMPIHQIVGASSYMLEYDRTAHARLLAQGVKASFQVLPEDGLLAESLRGADLLAAIAGAHFDP